jgi:hypothetical protein
MNLATGRCPAYSVVARVAGSAVSARRENGGGERRAREEEGLRRAEGLTVLRPGNGRAWASTPASLTSMMGTSGARNRSGDVRRRLTRCAGSYHSNLENGRETHEVDNADMPRLPSRSRMRLARIAACFAGSVERPTFMQAAGKRIPGRLTRSRRRVHSSSARCGPSARLTGAMGQRCWRGPKKKGPETGRTVPKHMLLHVIVQRLSLTGGGGGSADSIACDRRGDHPVRVGDHSEASGSAEFVAGALRPSAVHPAPFSLVR